MLVLLARAESHYIAHCFVVDSRFPLHVFWCMSAAVADQKQRKNRTTFYLFTDTMPPRATFNSLRAMQCRSPACMMRAPVPAPAARASRARRQRPIFCSAEPADEGPQTPPTRELDSPVMLKVRARSRVSVANAGGPDNSLEAYMTLPGARKL